jgi:hypothetical protein
MENGERTLTQGGFGQVSKPNEKLNDDQGGFQGAGDDIPSQGELKDDEFESDDGESESEAL